ncbi:MAG: ABC transporter ATP-binding protein [Lautropia sp.]|nr:ABC transporter ATP-binding protein [Lautropia sp.]
MSFLCVDRLSVRYPGADSPTLDGLSLQLESGEIGCLLGASGCGKTTVLRVVAGFIAPQQGRVVLAGRGLTDARQVVPPEERQIGLVFQDFALFPHLTVADNVGFGLNRLPRSERADRVADMLALTRLTAQARRYPHELSGGQQQRVALARALAPQPSLLLLDEPFSSLDAALREQLGLEVRQILKATGTTAVLVTHDQREAFAVCDQIGIIRDGRMEQWDTAYNLYHRPVSEYVARFIGEGVMLPGLCRDAADGMPLQVRTELGCITEAGECQPAARPEYVAKVLMRPDDVVYDQGASLRGEVVQKVFRGADYLYTLRLPSGAEVMALVPSRYDHALGEAIGIRLETAHIVSFRDERGEIGSLPF